PSPRAGTRLRPRRARVPRPSPPRRPRPAEGAARATPPPRPPPRPRGSGGASRLRSRPHASIAPVGEFALAALLVFGAIRFPNSGSPAAQPPFLRGVTALHNFDYEVASASFREA